MTDMNVISPDFERDSARLKAKAAAGGTVYVVSTGEQFIFQWQRKMRPGCRSSGKKSVDRPRNPPGFFLLPRFVRP